MISKEQFEELFPLACAWAREQEAIALNSGIPLSPQQLADAKRIEVSSPDQVCLLRISRMPQPADPQLASAAASTGILSPRTVGITFRYGIFIRADCWHDRRLVAHELVHTRQYELHGGIEAFLRPYLLECITPPGYPHGPLENEADRVAGEICR